MGYGKFSIMILDKFLNFFGFSVFNFKMEKFQFLRLLEEFYDYVVEVQNSVWYKYRVVIIIIVLFF